MSFTFIPDIGLVHFLESKRPRVVPGPERHRWDRKANWGESTTCLKCGCIKHRLKTQPFYTERYQMPGATESQEERPPCTNSKLIPKPKQEQLPL